MNNELTKMPDEKYLSMMNDLSMHHSIFYSLWQTCKPFMTDSHDKRDTAYVKFNSDGNCIDFIINKNFWESLTEYQQKFIFMHEASHILYSHGKRSCSIIGKNSSELSNIAADLVVNHMLVSKFGMDRKLIDPDNKFCWVDKFFKDKDNIKTDGSFEYYYNLLKDISLKNIIYVLIGSHGENGSSYGSSVDMQDYDDLEKTILEKLSGNSDCQQFQDIFNNNTAGSMAGNIILQMDTSKVVKKKKWESVIKKWEKKVSLENSKEVEQWARINRRFILLNNSFFIPTEMENEEHTEENNKIGVWFFLDTSGSCQGIAPRFFKAAKSLSEEKFDIKLFCFDTEIYKTDLALGKLYGFGGTSFSIIEEYIIKNCKNNYPKAVFILTDGYGDDVTPKYPDRWFWFLTNNGTTSCIPTKSKIYKLSNFE